MRRILPFILTLLALVQGARAEVVSQVYTYQHLSHGEMHQLIEPLLTEKGKMVFYHERNRVLVQDEAPVHSMISAILRDTDRVQPNVRVEVSFAETGARDESGATVRWRTGNDRVSVGNQPGSGTSIHVDAIDRNVTTSRRSGQFLVVRSGGTASLRVVQEIPYVDYFFQFARGRGYVTEDVRWRSVGSQLGITPRVQGALIHLEVMPQISALVQGRPQVISYRDLATTVTLRDGQSLHVGGFDRAGEEFNRLFFTGARRSQSSSSGGFEVRASILR